MTLKEVPFVIFIIFIFGLLMLFGGIRIIRNKRTMRVSKHTNPDLWKEPRIITGNPAIKEGVSAIIFGVVIIVFSLMEYFFPR